MHAALILLQPAITIPGFSASGGAQMRAFKWTGVGSVEPSTPGDVSSVDLIALSAGDIGRDEVASVLTEDLSG
jgi:hypothetical protein